jgi:ParB family chromosome partitioning protein
MASRFGDISLTRYDDLFRTEEERQADQQERIVTIPADQVYPYARQPYTIERPTPDLARLMDSIERIGIAEPLIVRPREAGGYEIISGHRRDYCAKVVGLETRPAIVREYTDEEADILVVDYNINREDLLPSEKAKAYKLKLDAMKRQGARTDLTSCQLGTKLRADKLLAEKADDSARQIQRYIRLTKLIPTLLEQVDNGKLKMVPAADFISHLSEKEQTYLLMVMERDEVSPSVGQARRLKEISAEGKLEDNIIDVIMREEKPLERKVMLDGNWVKRRFPQNMTPQQIMERINKALDLLERAERRKEEKGR